MINAKYYTAITVLEARELLSHDNNSMFEFEELISSKNIIVSSFEAIKIKRKGAKILIDAFAQEFGYATEGVFYVRVNYAFEHPTNTSLNHYDERDIEVAW